MYIPVIFYIPHLFPCLKGSQMVNLQCVSAYVCVHSFQGYRSSHLAQIIDIFCEIKSIIAVTREPVTVILDWKATGLFIVTADSWGDPLFFESSSNAHIINKIAVVYVFIYYNNTTQLYFWSLENSSVFGKTSWCHKRTAHHVSRWCTIYPANIVQWANTPTQIRSDSSFQNDINECFLIWCLWLRFGWVWAT